MVVITLNTPYICPYMVLKRVIGQPQFLFILPLPCIDSGKGIPYLEKLHEIWYYITIVIRGCV
jgi:hypothetical protein